MPIEAVKKIKAGKKAKITRPNGTCVSFWKDGKSLIVEKPDGSKRKISPRPSK